MTTNIRQGVTEDALRLTQPRRARKERWGRRVRLIILFIATLLLANALIGENGVLALWRLRAETASLAAELDRLRDESVRLREQARGLREDPGAIEGVARRELGLVKPGERMVIVPR
jgi:cell division protein FtsB